MTPEQKAELKEEFDDNFESEFDKGGCPGEGGAPAGVHIHCLEGKCDGCTEAREDEFKVFVSTHALAKCRSCGDMNTYCVCTKRIR